MNAKQLIASVAVFAAAGSAIADSTGNFTDFVNLPSSRTRADVAAEINQTRVANNYAVVGGDEVANPVAQYAGANTGRTNTTNVATTHPKTRTEVIGELKQAQAEGSYVVGGEEYVAPFAVARNGRNRNAVRSEAIAAQRSKRQPGAQESGN